MERESGRGRRRAAGERQRWLDRSTKGIGLARGLGCFSFGEVAGRVEGCVYSCTRISSRRQRRRRPRGTGGVGPEPRVPGTSWTALTLEVGKFADRYATASCGAARKAVAKLCEWSSSRWCVSDSSRYISSRAQYAAAPQLELMVMLRGPWRLHRPFLGRQRPSIRQLDPDRRPHPESFVELGYRGERLIEPLRSFPQDSLNAEKGESAARTTSTRIGYLRGYLHQ